METLSLKVGQLHCQSTTNTRTGRSRCRTPRLPTPETSTSSFDESEGRVFESSKYDPASDTSMQPRSRTDSTHSDAFFHKPASESTGHRGAASRTPPYHSIEPQRPSLPSLKFILGDELASPPRTPSIPSAASQLAPREPVGRPNSHWPPSLYPNKKQKTGNHESIPSLSDMDRLTARPTSTFTLGPIRSHLAHDTGHGSARSRSPGLPSPLGTSGIQGSGEPSRSHYARQYAPPAPLLATSSTQNHELQLPGPPSAGSERSWKGGFAPIDNRTLQSQMEHSHALAERPEFRSLYAGSEQSHAPSTNYAFPPSPYRPTEGYRNGYPERRHSHSRSDYGPPGYPTDHGPDAFVSAPYEYSYPKTRKRSNLPKQSTEIMRSWFDQNIENPYPSEEQKAHFASATGISMTQVSNWFINHRRRCPELRDRRVERRKV